MDETTAALTAICILALLVIGFFAVFRTKGKFSVRTKFGELKAEGENAPRPTNVAGGVKIKGAEAGGVLRVHSEGFGGVDLENVKAKRNIEATHMPSELPPKA